MNDIYFIKKRLDLYSKPQIKEKKVCFTNITEYIFIHNNIFLRENNFTRKIWWSPREEKQMKINYKLGRW